MLTHARTCSHMLTHARLPQHPAAVQAVDRVEVCCHFACMQQQSQPHATIHQDRSWGFANLAACPRADVPIGIAARPRGRVPVTLPVVLLLPGLVRQRCSGHHAYGHESICISGCLASSPLRRSCQLMMSCLRMVHFASTKKGTFKKVTFLVL